MRRVAVCAVQRAGTMHCRIDVGEIENNARAVTLIDAADNFIPGDARDGPGNFHLVERHPDRLFNVATIVDLNHLPSSVKPIKSNFRLADRHGEQSGIVDLREHRLNLADALIASDSERGSDLMRAGDDVHFRSFGGVDWMS